MTSMDTSTPRPMRYWAFISYAHEDRAYAERLHRRLESFKIPPSIPREFRDASLNSHSIRPVFLDRLELASTSDLSGSIEAALGQSAFLIVVCSPIAAASVRVNAEIEYFQGVRGRDRILTLLVDGRPNAAARGARAAEECLPGLLRESGGTIAREQEPLAADVRPGKGNWDDAIAQLVAGLLGVGLDTIRQRELLARQQRLRWIAGSACAVAVLAAGISVQVWQLRQAAIRSEQRAIAEADAAKAVTNFMVGVFRVSDPSESLGNVVRARDLLDAGAAEIQSVDGASRVQGQLLRTIGTAYRQLGLYSQARPMLEQAVRISQDATESDRLEMSESLYQLALLNQRTDQRTDAESQLAESLRQLEPCEEESTNCAFRYLALGSLMTSENRVPEALANLDRAMHFASLAESGDSRVKATILDAKGHLHREQAQYDMAELETAAALGMRQRIHGQLHPEVAKSHYALALLFQETRKLEQAMEQVQQAVAIDNRVYGPEHPESLLSLSLLGILYAEQGEFEKALPYFEDTLEGRVRVYGPDHTSVGYAAYNLGHLFGDMKRYDDAIDLMKRAQEIWETSQGAEHPDVAYALDQRGKYLLRLGRVAEAEPIIEQALAINLKAFDRNHPNVARSQLNLARVRIAQQRIDQAHDLFESALMIQTAKFGADSDVVLATRKEFEPVMSMNVQPR